MKVVLAYSGGLDTSIIIPWLRERHDAEVVAFCADLGQGEELAPLKAKALASGAVRFHLRDLRREFVTDYAFPVLRAGARYEGRYLLGTSMARPLIAKHLVEIARAEGAQAVAHGATGKGNDQVRFEVSVRALAPDLKIIAPWREWEIRSREDAMDYAARHGISVPATRESPYSRDRNLWHLSHEGGILEDPSREMPAEVLQLSCLPEAASAQPSHVEIGFSEGTPVSVDGEELGPVELVERLNELGGAHGVGTVDMVENRLVGIKSRGVYETPGGTLLWEAHRQLEAVTLDRTTAHYKEQVALRYADLVYDGWWFSPLREALDAFVAATQRDVTGSVRLKLYRGGVYPAGVRSPRSLYDPQLATFGEDASYDQKDAAGFIRLFGLPLEVRSRVHGR
ncbi:MAG: argininosuccinate synthase [Thermaerobacter sp.]|jgi:argininosuccinate synthase|nr:argininosuccinate synthase [Thermaerobacter sp.]